MNRRGCSGLMALLALACTRELTAPPAPRPGTIQGRVVYDVPGQPVPVPAAGAVVTVLSTSAGAIADSNGRFLIEGITATDGRLLIQLDLDANGAPDLQTLLQLATLKAAA